MVQVKLCGKDKVDWRFMMTLGDLQSGAPPQTGRHVDRRGACNVANEQETSIQAINREPHRSLAHLAKQSLREP